jgi:hypothetical protein
MYGNILLSQRKFGNHWPSLVLNSFPDHRIVSQHPTTLSFGIHPTNPDDKQKFNPIERLRQDNVEVSRNVDAYGISWTECEIYLKNTFGA